MKVAIVIGGSGGLGSAICKSLALAGFHVVITFYKNQQTAEELCNQITGQGLSASYGSLDLREITSVHEFIEEIDEQFGRIDCVINATGSDIPMRFISEVSHDEMKSVIENDVMGFFSLCSAALPHLRQSKGSLVAITSAGLARYPKRDILSVAPKAAITALIKGIAKEEGRFGVRANTVAVGVVDAGIFHRLQEKEDLDSSWTDAAKKNTALGRIGSADEVAKAVTFLASNNASYITGQVLFVDGGYHL